MLWNAIAFHWKSARFWECACHLTQNSAQLCMLSLLFHVKCVNFVDDEMIIETMSLSFHFVCKTLLDSPQFFFIFSSAYSCDSPVLVTMKSHNGPTISSERREIKWCWNKRKLTKSSELFIEAKILFHSSKTGKLKRKKLEKKNDDNDIDG